MPVTLTNFCFQRTSSTGRCRQRRGGATIYRSRPESSIKTLGCCGTFRGFFDQFWGDERKRTIKSMIYFWILGDQKAIKQASLSERTLDICPCVGPFRTTSCNRAKKRSDFGQQNARIFDLQGFGDEFFVWI